MDLNLDSLYVASNRFLKFTPVLTDGDNSITLSPVIVTGRRQDIMYKRLHEKEYKKEGITPVVIRRKNNNEQTVSFNETVDYVKWMETAELRVAEDLCGCGGNPLEQESTLLAVCDFAEPVIIPVYVPSPVMAFVTPRQEVIKVRSESGSAFLDFPVNKTVINPEYRNNAAELAKIRGTIDLVKNDANTSITHISIHGYASPEGSYSGNSKLAQGRAEALKKYVANQYNFVSSLFDVQSTPEDWEGLRRYIAESDMVQKDEILSAIDGTLDPDARERKIKGIDNGTAYSFLLQNVFPALRHSDYMVQYTVRSFSLDEAKQQFKTRPQLLSLEEMFAVARTYEAGSPEFKDVFDVAVRVFPEDETANLNSACIYLEEGNLDRAEKYLDKAGNSPEASNARGVLAMLKGDYDRAETLLQSALKSGVKEASSNLEELEKVRENVRQRAINDNK